MIGRLAEGSTFAKATADDRRKGGSTFAKASATRGRRMKGEREMGRKGEIGLKDPLLGGASFISHSFSEGLGWVLGKVQIATSRREFREAISVFDIYIADSK